MIYLRAGWEKEFAEREKKSLWGMVFRVLGGIRAKGENVTPSTKWRKVERREKQTKEMLPLTFLLSSGKTGKNLNWIGDAVLAETGLCGA